MKILFYLEPHPVRTPEEFKSVGVDILSMIVSANNNHEWFHPNPTIKILASRSLHKCLSDSFEDINKYLVGLTKDENDFIAKKYFVDWDLNALNTWADLLRGDGEVTDFYFNILKRVYSGYKFDVAVAWGTNGAIKKFCSTFNIPVIFMELGCTRSPFFESIYLDYLGVNGASYSHRFSLADYQPIFSLDEIQTFLPVSQHNGMRLDANFSLIQNLENKKKLYSSDGKNVLIPLQLMDDTNILLYSTYSSMEHFLSTVVPELLAAGFNCYIKPHPGAKERLINQLDHNKCKEYIADLENVYWCDDINPHTELLSFYHKMDYFLVLNSSVGFEGMLLGKIVICLDVSPYNISDYTYKYEDLINGTINIEIHLKETTKIVNAILFKYLHMKQDMFTLPTFLNKLSYAIDISRTFGYKDDSIIDPHTLSNTITTWDLETYPRLRRTKIPAPKSEKTLKTSVIPRSSFIKSESIVSLIDSGDSAFKNSNYMDALRFYESALKISRTEKMKNLIQSRVSSTKAKITNK